MKKYKLKIKDVDMIHNNYGLDIICDNRGLGYIWLQHGLSATYCYNKREYNAKAFTEEDINKFPYGFIQQHELIEVEEELYYIKLPYAESFSSYINYYSKNDKVIISNRNETTDVKTRFTKQEIEEKFPFYANDTCMIKVEDDE